MGCIPSFKVGDVVSNAVLSETFKCGNMGGMRRSKVTGTLVIVSDNTKSLYSDKWEDGVLKYTGQGKNGDQKLEGNQNKTLAESRTNGVEIHFFEVNEPRKYTYGGVVELAGEPYQEEQLDDKKEMRKVWVFPLRRKHPAVAVVPFDPSNPSVGTAVKHSKYGVGKITGANDINVYVEFDVGKRIFKYPQAFEQEDLVPVAIHTSELRRILSEERFVTAFRKFQEQVDKNAETGKAEGSQTLYGLSTSQIDGGDLTQHFGQGAASETPYVNWHVVSIYYVVKEHRIVIGIEKDRYQHIYEMSSLKEEKIGNRQSDIAVFYEADVETVDYDELYEKFILVSEKVIRLGL